jgi:hypothetical protein
MRIKELAGAEVPEVEHVPDLTIPPEPATALKPSAVPAGRENAGKVADSGTPFAPAPVQ